MSPSTPTSTSATDASPQPTAEAGHTAETDALIAEANARLARARSERRAIPQLTDDLHGLDLATAYRIQRVQREASDRLVGWKLGVTSRAKQLQVGIDAPIRGFLAPEHALDLGESLDTSQHIQPRAEPEIAFLMGSDLEGDHITSSDVLAATAQVAVGIEILDSRFEDYRFTMPDVVADNTSASRFVVGAGVAPEGIDLRLVGVVLEKNGEVVGTASGAASLGHPASAVAWLVRSLAAEGEKLAAGSVVLSGGLTAAVPLTAGDVVVVTIDRIGSLTLPCR